jgi:hypothetical protein
MCYQRASPFWTEKPRFPLGKVSYFKGLMVLRERIELSTSPLPTLGYLQ